MDILSVVLAGAAFCSVIYCVLVLVGVVRYLAVERPRPAVAPPITIVSPLCGMEDGLEENLRASFAQRYPEFEILFGVHRKDDPALQVVLRLMAEFPAVPARIIVTGDPPCPNRKVFSLECMVAEARHELLLMKDSDVRIGPDTLEVISAEFQNRQVGLIVCPYKASPVSGFWWELDALGLNTRFLGGVLVARILGGMDFALGPALAARKEVLDRIGGLSAFRDYLAEDFLIGNIAHRRGCGVILSSCRVDHRFGGGDFRSNLRHRLRWVRSTRCSRRWAYLGEVFTHPLPLGLVLLLWNPHWWPLSGLTFLMRAVSASVTTGRVLGSPLSLRQWVCLPLEDAVSFAIWIFGLFGNEITWRGVRYRLSPDGRMAQIR